MRLELNDVQRETLADALESYLLNLRYEIGDTDAQDFRDVLKAKKETLEEIVERLRPGSA